jgi:hypothetical protein
MISIPIVLFFYGMDVVELVSVHDSNLNKRCGSDM